MAITKPPMKNKISLIIFFTILIIAATIRLFKLDTLVTPYWEEAALGYDAYSISETGKDHHGNPLPIVAFESFGDWKPAGYFYATVPFIKVLGLSVLATRLPSALAGLSIVIGVFVLLKQILPTTYLKNQPYLPHLGMFVAAISPWGIIFSRAAWEVNLATALITWGVIAFFSFIKNQNYKMAKFLTSIILLVLSMYTYHSTRVIAPLLGFMLIAVWLSVENHSIKFIDSCKKFFSHNLSYLITGLVFSLLIVSPFVFSDVATTSQRFKETSIFSDLNIIEKSNEGQLQQPNIFGKIFYHRYLLFGTEIIKNYLSHFDINFLFLSGDTNARHSTQFFGQLYHLEIVYLFFGLIFLSQIFRKTHHNNFDSNLQPFWIFLIGWLLISILPASLTYGTPHALRILPSLPVWIILITVGISQFSQNIGKNYQKLFFLGVIFFYLIELTAFWRFYSKIYPQKYAQEWQFGYQQLVQTINQNSDQSTPIFITREQGRPAMYWWFYTQTKPQLVQTSDSTAKHDQGEFLEFNNLRFVRTLDEVQDQVGAIVAGSTEQIYLLQNKIGKEISILDEITAPNGDIIWMIGRIL